MRHFVRTIAFLGMTAVFSSVFAASQGQIEIVVTPTAGSVARGSQRVPMAQLTLKNGCVGPAVLEELRVKLGGLGDRRGIERLYVMGDGVRVSRAASPRDREDTALHLRRLSLPPCEARTLSIVADLATNVSIGSHYTLTVTGADTEGATPKILQRGSSTLTTAAGDSAGTLEVELLPPSRDPTYGKNRMIARLRLKGDSTRDQVLTAITLTNHGSARDRDLQQLFLERSSGQMVSFPLRALDEDRARFVLDPPLLVGRNQVLILSVRADVLASSRRTLRLLVDDPADVETRSCAGKRGCDQAH